MDFVGVQIVLNKNSEKPVNKPDDISNTHKPNKKNKGKKQKSTSSNGIDLVESQGDNSAQPASLGVQGGNNMGNNSVKSVIPVEMGIDRLSQEKDDNANLQKNCATKTCVSTLDLHSKVCNDDTNIVTTKSNKDASGEKINNGKAAHKTINTKDASSETIDESKKLLESKAKSDIVGMPISETIKQKNAKNKKAKQTAPTAKPANESSMMDSLHESLATKNNKDAYMETFHNGNATSRKINNKIASSETMDKNKKLLESKDKTAKFGKHCSDSVENVSIRVGVLNNLTINEKIANIKIRPTNPSTIGISDNHFIFTGIEVPCVPRKDKFETVCKKNKNTTNEISNENNFLKSMAHHKKNRRYDKRQILTDMIGKKPSIGAQCSSVDSDVHIHDSNPSAFLALESGRKSFQEGCCNSATGQKVQDDSDLESVRSLPITQDSHTVESALSSRLSYAATSIKQSDQGSVKDGGNSHAINSNDKTPTLHASPSVAHKKDKDGIVHLVDSMQPCFAAKHTKNRDTVTHPIIQSHELSKVKSGNYRSYGKKQKSVIFFDKHVEETPASLGISFGFEVEPVDINLSHIEVIDTISSVKLESEQTYVINDVHSQENIQFLDDIKHIGNMNPPSVSSSNASVISSDSVQNHETKSAKVRKSSKHLVKITNSHPHSQENIQFLEDENNIENDSMNYLPNAPSSNASVKSNGLQHEVNEDIHVDKFNPTSKFRDYVYYGESVTTAKKEIERPSQTNEPTKYCGMVKYREINLKSNFNFAEALMFLNTEWDRARILLKNKPSKLKVILE